MGIQDRDYYWEKHKEASKINSRDSFENLLNRKPRGSRRHKQNGIRYLFYSLLALWGLGHGADTLLKYLAAKKNTPPPIQITPAPIYSPPVVTEEPTSGGVILRTDRQGHFRGTVLVNNVPMPFMIDTGATRTVVPRRLASAAGLAPGRYHRANTAGGDVVEQETQISTLKIGNAIIKNLDASINEHLEEVLIGMNTLKYFHITQNDNTLTLIAKNQVANQFAQTPIPYEAAPFVPLTLPNQNALTPNQPIRKPTTIKKTVTCDARQVCTTKFSDH